jgi:hypothetical protein
VYSDAGMSKGKYLPIGDTIYLSEYKSGIAKVSHNVSQYYMSTKEIKGINAGVDTTVELPKKVVAKLDLRADRLKKDNNKLIFIDSIKGMKTIDIAKMVSSNIKAISGISNFGYDEALNTISFSWVNGYVKFDKYEEYSATYIVNIWVKDEKIKMQFSEILMYYIVNNQKPINTFYGIFHPKDWLFRYDKLWKKIEGFVERDVLLFCNLAIVKGGSDF